MNYINPKKKKQKNKGFMIWLLCLLTFLVDVYGINVGK